MSTNLGVWVKNSIQPAPTVKPVKLPPTKPQPGDGQTEKIYREAIAWFSGAVKRTDALIAPAESAAKRIIAGGELYADGTSGFAMEMFSRAGGYGFLKKWSGEPIKANDVLFFGMMRSREPDYEHSLTVLTWKSRRIPGQVMHFSSRRWPYVKRTIPTMKLDRWGGRLALIDTDGPDGSSWSDISLNQMATIATAWALQGEMFAAASRNGKTLATLASDAEPNGKLWDRSVRGKKLNPRFKLPAIPAGKISREYYLACQKQLVAFLNSDQTGQVRLAAERLAAAVARGKRVFVVISGHLHVTGALVPRSFRESVIVYGRPWQWRDEVLEKGDVLLDFGYLTYPTRRADKALKRGAEVVTISVADGPTDKNRTHIKSLWSNWDSVINVTGYPVRILPSSGVVQTVQWYALMDETEKAMKRLAKRSR